MALATILHGTVLRNLGALWIPVELGAPGIIEPDPEPLAWYGRQLGLIGEAQHEQDMSEAQIAQAIKFGTEVRLLANRLFQHGTLAAGTYQVRNVMPAELTFYEDMAPVPWMPDTDVFPFAVTPEHLRLLGWVDAYDEKPSLPCIDGKRPYGSSYYEADIARILNWVIEPDEYGEPEMSREQDELAAKLHSEMLWVMMAFLQHARLERQFTDLPDQ
ncbi:hypothetical protein [Chitinimonas sp. JJ19]|uniref:hypothetical protein n=1 Tax=Chitinimonas sp. JJ19 TaxID=3109352 RepID=UPI003000559E